MATGCLSMPKKPDIEGHNRFLGETYFTSSWPHQDVDFSGKRVAVIGTGSSGVQSIPLIAEQADGLDRISAHALLLHSGTERAGTGAPDGRARAGPAEIPRSGAAVTLWRADRTHGVGALQVSDEERQARYEGIWEAGALLGIAGAYADIITNPKSNETLCEFVREQDPRDRQGSGNG